MTFYVCRVLVLTIPEPGEPFKARVLTSHTGFANTAVEEALAALRKRKVAGEVGELVIVAAAPEVPVKAHNTIVHVKGQRWPSAWRYAEAMV